MNPTNLREPLQSKPKSTKKRNQNLRILLTQKRVPPCLGTEKNTGKRSLVSPSSFLGFVRLRGREEKSGRRKEEIRREGRERRDRVFKEEKRRERRVCACLNTAGDLVHVCHVWG